MRKKLTARQQEIYDFIAQVIRNQGYPPTIREIMEAFGIASTNGVRTTLSALEKKGYIRRTAMLSRSIELTDYQARDASLSGDVREVPVIGRVAAGEPILAMENIESTLAVDSGFVPRGDVFALQVEGDSMRDAGILDGDFVLARHQESALQGEIVVAVIGEEATVKRYYREGSQVKLMPENEAYQPIVVGESHEPFRIAGKIVGLMRSF
ncbi:MAG: transcriptional repressor LexA [Candidatus Latescibacteria bacterium]|nr:transcriptional repressor LexA [Candidatus Latescibacterota bacterium]MCY4352158.1 transcriptional repressor LexA [Gemmatimonadota bacterium]